MCQINVDQAVSIGHSQLLDLENNYPAGFGHSQLLDFENVPAGFGHSQLLDLENN